MDKETIIASFCVAVALEGWAHVGACYQLDMGSKLLLHADYQHEPVLELNYGTDFSLAP